jgi:hypothetical protein
MRSIVSSIVALAFLSLSACAVSPERGEDTQSEASASTAFIQAPEPVLAGQPAAHEEALRAPVRDIGKEREELSCRDAQGCPLDPIPSRER